MADAEVAAEFQGLKAGEERRGRADLRCGSRSDEVYVRCKVPNVLQEIRSKNPFCADARNRRRKKEC